MSGHPRVLQALAGAAHGGAEAFFVRLALALARAGLEQKIVLRPDTARVERFRAAGIEPVELPFGGPFDIRTRPAFARTIAAFRPRIVVTWMNRATRFCPKGDFVHVARLGGYYDLRYYRGCDHLIGNTEDIVAYLVRSGWPADRAHYLPNFVDATPAAPAPRASLATPADAPVVLALGRLHPNKGFDVLIDALAAVPDAILWLAGEGPEREALATRSSAAGVAGRVRFLGWREDVAALLAAATVFVCPSRHEPLGNVVLEAWAHGAPVVAAASEGPAALISDGEDGLLVPVDDAPALAAALDRALGDASLRARLAAAGRARHALAFAEDGVVARYLAFFDRIAA